MRLWFLGCITPPGVYGDLREQAMDWDGDGDRAERYGGTDCDDGDDTRSGKHAEVCADDGVDEDCDGQVDEGLQTTWFFDEDGDGYTSNVGYAGCSPDVAGESSEEPGGDCNGCRSRSDRQQAGSRGVGVA